MTCTLDAGARWRFDRAVARVEVVHTILADYATSYCGRPLRRRDLAPRVIWTIDGDVMAEYVHHDEGPGRLIVREVALVGLIKKQLRSRHVTIEYGGSDG